MATKTDVLWSGDITKIVSGDSITDALTDAQGRGGKLNLGLYSELAVFARLKTLTGGSSPTYQLLVSTSDGETGTDEEFNNLNPGAPSWTSANEYFNSIGAGEDNGHSLGVLGRITYNLTGTPATADCYVTIYGKRDA